MFFPRWYTALAIDFRFLVPGFQVPNLQGLPSSRANSQVFRHALDFQGIKIASSHPVIGVWVEAMHLFFPQWYTALATDFTLGSWFQSSRAPVPNPRSRPSSRTNFQGFRLALELQGIEKSPVVTLTNEKNKHYNFLTYFFSEFARICCCILS